jgi:hypothetical protein
MQKNFYRPIAKTILKKETTIPSNQTAQNNFVQKSKEKNMQPKYHPQLKNQIKEPAIIISQNNYQPKIIHQISALQVQND